jgi:AraC family transcriptional regulator, positive regulator of tynA and feaB
MQAHENPTPELSGVSPLQVWDTSYGPSAQAFSAFRDGVCSSFMPWTHGRFCSESPFFARMEVIRFDPGLIGRIRAAPTQAIRTQIDIDNSSFEGVYASLRLFGDAHIEQNKKSVYATPGDLTIFDSTIPTIHTGIGSSNSDAIALLIPKMDLALEARSIEGPYLIPKQKLIPPLAAGLDFITQNFSSLSRDELRGLYDACLHTIPVAMGCYKNIVDEQFIANPILREIYAFVDENINVTALSAKMVAIKFDISERYVHKLFASIGCSFSHYVTRRRLERIRVDLVNPALRRKPIAYVAYRWGFNDLSTFNRAFRKLFGCSPRRYRN